MQRAFMVREATRAGEGISSGNLRHYPICASTTIPVSLISSIFYTHRDLRSFTSIEPVSRLGLKKRDQAPQLRLVCDAVQSVISGWSLLPVYLKCRGTSGARYYWSKTLAVQKLINQWILHVLRDTREAIESNMDTSDYERLGRDRTMSLITSTTRLLRPPARRRSWALHLCKNSRFLPA